MKSIYLQLIILGFLLGCSNQNSKPESPKVFVSKDSLKKMSIGDLKKSKTTATCDLQ